MKHQVFLLFMTVSTLAVHGQRDHELHGFYKFGFSTNSFNSTLFYNDPGMSADVLWFGAHLLQEHAFLAEYKFEVWKKAKLYVLGGFEIGQTNYYIPIFNLNGYEIGDINFNQKKVGYLFGIAKRFELYDSKVKIDVGWRIKDIYPLSRNVNFSQDWSFSELRPWIEYKYSLDADYRQRFDYYGQRGIGLSTFLRGEPYVNMQFNVYKNWFLNVQVSYQRNNYFYYNFTYDIQYYYGGSSTPNGFENFLGISGGDDRFFKNDDLIYTSIGVTYNFNSKKEDGK
jgi:hypothetical protein